MQEHTAAFWAAEELQAQGRSMHSQDSKVPTLLPQVSCAAEKLVLFLQDPEGTSILLSDQLEKPRSKRVMRFQQHASLCEHISGPWRGRS